MKCRKVLTVEWDEEEGVRRMKFTVTAQSVDQFGGLSLPATDEMVSGQWERGIDG